MSDSDLSGRIDAKPTKAFFIDMLTRDIGLEQAILDLIDNSVDGAKRISGDGARLEGRSVRLSFNDSKFRLIDNCGGFDRLTAQNYAFRFGRPKGSADTPNSIGQFGIGMKRALFKFGRKFSVRSATPQDLWAVDIDVEKWEESEDWHFEWVDFGPQKPLSHDRPGTEIVVTQLRPNVSARFATRSFNNAVIDLVKSKHRQFIAQGLSIRINGFHVNALEIALLATGGITPGVISFPLQDEGEKDVHVTIKVGVGLSSPKEAGWYVICNGRVVLDADRSSSTGWGQVEASFDRVMLPSFHNQFARFRGIVTFDSIDSKRVPWSTTKNDIDQDSSVWARAYPRMLEMARPVIDFLNEVSEDIDEKTREGSALNALLSQSYPVRSDNLTHNTVFSAPKRTEVDFGPDTVKIQYSRLRGDIEFLKGELGLKTAKAVGEKTFDLTLKRHRA